MDSRRPPLALAHLIAFAVLTAATASCASDAESELSDGDRLFAATTATADAAQLPGIWETATPLQAGPISLTSRLEIGADHVVMASRCTLEDKSAGPVTVSIRVGATVTADAIVFHEGGQEVQRIGPGVCGVQLAKGTLPACTDGPSAAPSTCFNLGDGALTLMQPGGAYTFQKIRD